MIIQWLQRIDATLGDINDMTDDIEGKLVHASIPEARCVRIETYFEPVESIKDEVAKLACGWKFTPRVERLRARALWRRLVLSLGLESRSSVSRGADDGPDLENYYDWSAVRRLNLIQYAEREGLRGAPSEAALAAPTRRSRGRDALGLHSSPTHPATRSGCPPSAAAELGNVMVETGDTQTAMLELGPGSFERRAVAGACSTMQAAYLRRPDHAARSTRRGPTVSLLGRPADEWMRTPCTRRSGLRACVR